MSDSLPFNTQLIHEAVYRLKKRVRRTELIYSHYFSERLDLPLWFKCENLQRTGAFKIRGAMNFMTATPKEQLKNGVITASAGNHAQGVAFAADLLGVKATVYMPETTPPQKVFSTRDYGAEVVLAGRNFDEACEAAYAAGLKSGALFVHPFDDELVIAGQGTIGLEILEDIPDLANIIVPIGGGGLIAGVAAAIKDTRPDVRVIGVESKAAPGMYGSLQRGKVKEAAVKVSLADGIAVKRVGKKTFPIVQSLVDEVVLVDEEDISLAIVSLLERTKVLVEGAGAAPLAALLSGAAKGLAGKTVCLLSGGNIDVKTISVVVERGLVAAGRYLKLRIELDDMPGALARLTAEIARVNANISIITHDRRSKSLPIGKTEVLIELETRGADHTSEVVRHLESVDYKVVALK